MEKHRDLGELVRTALERNAVLERQEIGADARLSKNGMVFETESYAVKDLGHLCVLRMKAFLGLMKMETVVLSVTGRDAPLFNLDWVSAAGKETLIAELYDVQLQPLPQEELAVFQALQDRDADLPGREKKPHWYDDILYPCSYDKAGKKLSARFNRAAEDYLGAYLALLEKLPACGEEEKSGKVRAFAQTLVEQGGPAVDSMTKLFGPETTRRLVLKHMYGVKP